MKDIGMTRKLDGLVRLLIPKEILNTCHIQPSDCIEFLLEGATISVTKYNDQTCEFCKSKEELTAFKKRFICSKCRYLIIHSSM